MILRMPVEIDQRDEVRLTIGRARSRNAGWRNLYPDSVCIKMGASLRWNDELCR